MLIPLFLLLAAVSPGGSTPGPDEQPVRVWLEPRAAGSGVRVYVQTRADGYLMVLRRGADGGVEILFPDAPERAAYTPAGTYEIAGADGGAAFTVLAALASDSFRTAEFARGAAWDETALAAPGEDGAETVLTELVQRMLGDESFNYDLATCTGALPPASSVVIVSETFVAPTALIYAPVFLGRSAQRRSRLERTTPAPVAPAQALAVYDHGRPAPVPALPPIVVVQRRTLVSREERPLLPSRRVTAGAVPSAVVFVPVMRVAAGSAPRPTAPAPAPRPSPRVFAVPSAGAPVVVPVRRR
jgi:hypothetical protein